MMRIPVAIMTGLLLVGCAGVPVVPPELKDVVDSTVTFAQLKGSPLSYKGRVIVMGGMVLTAKPLKQDGTRIEILETPLDADYEPTGRLTDSRGRFLAFHKGFLDPATIPAGTRVTVVGEVSGSMTLQVDEIDYAYPTLDIASLTIWPPQLPSHWFRPYPYMGAYWGPYGGSYWGPPQWIPWPVGGK